MSGKVDAEATPLLSGTGKGSYSEEMSEFGGRSITHLTDKITNLGKNVRSVKEFDDKIYIAAFLVGCIFFFFLLVPCLYIAKDLKPYYSAVIIAGDVSVSGAAGLTALGVLKCIYGSRSSKEESEEIRTLWRDALHSGELSAEEQKELSLISRQSLHPIV